MLNSWLKLELSPRERHVIIPFDAHEHHAFTDQFAMYIGTSFLLLSNMIVKD